ncbi:MAG: DJ-1/PfpI family protein [Pseudomonadota bacterium]
MTINRRTLLGGMTGAAMLAPYLALERAMAQAHQAHGGHQAGAHSGHHAGMDHGAASKEAMARHDQLMVDLLGDNMVGQEQIAMLLYPGFTALDLVGPHYFFACMMGATVHLVTTEDTLAPVASDLGLAIQPTVTMADTPKDLDVLFFPGGTMGTMNVMRSETSMAWVKDRASRARHITSVCTGSLILAKAGLLKGKRATSHWATVAALEDFGAVPVADERVVTDGNIITGAGVSAGIDFALSMVAMMRGQTYAQGLMLQSEYAPQPPFEGGTLATSSDDMSEMMQMMFAPVVEEIRLLASV